MLRMLGVVMTSGRGVAHLREGEGRSQTQVPRGLNTHNTPAHKSSCYIRHFPSNSDR